MGLPKCRLDVWKPQVQTVDAQGGISTLETLAAWIKCDTAEDVSLNLKRANALEGVEINDGLYTPRIARLRLTNKPRNFRAFDTDVYTQQYQTSGGSNHGSALRLRASWGPLSRFFKEFLHVRIVDLETHMVLFAGQIYKIKNRFEGQRGAYIELECRDALQSLKDIKLKNVVKGIKFPANTRRSDVVQQFASLGFDYLTARADNDPEAKVLEPSLNSLQTLDLASSALTLNSNDNNTGATSDNGFYRFEKSEKAMVETEWKANKSGSDNLLQEMARWAVMEPHEDETEIDQFGYDFFVEPNIGRWGLTHTISPPPQMLNYYKRGNRLSAAGSANQQADVYGLTVKLPVIGSTVAHQGATQHNVGSLSGAISSSLTSIPVATAANNYAGQVITIDSEQLLVTQILGGGIGAETLTVIRGWDGSSAASHSNSAVIKEVRPAHAVMHQSFDFEDADDELFSEAVLEYVDTMVVGQKKFEKERTKRFEILYVTEVSGEFTWSGKKFDDQFISSNDVGAGQGSAEEFKIYREDGSTPYPSDTVMGRIQYQSAETASGSTNFAYILISDLHKTFPTANYDTQDYVVIKGLTSTDTCRVNLNAVKASEGRPATAWAGGNTQADDGRFFRKVLSLSRKNADEVDDLRSEVAARLARGTNPLKRGNFQMSKAPYYWYDGIIRTETDVTAGQTLTIKAQNGTAAVNVTNYGIREGMVVHKMNADFTAIEQANDNDVYGYITTLSSDTTFVADLTELQTFDVDDKIRIFIPLRAGDTVKADNIIADIYGEHLITGLTFTEDPQPRTEFETIGENEPRIRLKFGGVSKAGQSVWNQMLTDKVETQEKIARPPPVKSGLQTFTWDGTWTFPDYNTITWGASNVTSADGTTYQIAVGSTNDSTYGLGTDMAGSNTYVLYLDPEGENPDSNTYHIYTRIQASYIQDADNMVFMTAVPTDAGIGKPNCVKGPNFQTDFAFPHVSLNSDGKATVTAAGSAPSSPNVGDIWIDTATTNNFKRWNGSAWVTYDLGTAAAIGTAASTSATNAQNTADAKRTVFTASTAPSALAIGDMWVDSDDHKIYTASATGTGNWNLRDDAGAISNAGTNIDGGRIATQTIVLKEGGGGQETGGSTNGVLHTAAVSTSDGSANASRVILSNTGIYGYNSSGNFEFKLTTADGKGTFGGGTSTIGSDGILIRQTAAQAGSSSGTTVPKIAIQQHASRNDSKWMFWMENSADSLMLQFTGSVASTTGLSPNVANQYNLGHSILTWKNIYAGTHIYTPALTVSGNTMNLGGNALTAGEVLLLTSVLTGGSSTDAQSYHTHGNLGGGGGISAGDDVTWTGYHNFNGNVYINTGTIHIGNASTDTVTINAKIAVGGYAVPGLRWVDTNGTAGMWYDEDTSYSRIKFVMRGMNSETYMPYFSSDGTYSYCYVTTLNANYVKAYNGSTSSPAFAWVNDPDTGLYYNGGTAFTYAGITRLYIGSTAVFSNWDIDPQVNQGYNLGSSSLRWHTIFALNDLNTPSDAELKENKTTITNGLEFISSLNPISFNRIGSSDIQFGFTAQEVKQAVLNTGYTENAAVYSENINEDTGETEWSMTYAALIAPLVASIKELKERIEVLEGS